MKLVKVTLRKGVEGDPHKHAYEQISYVVKGKVEITADGKTNIYREGDGFCISPNVNHRGIALEDTTIAVVYSTASQELTREYLKNV